MLFYLFFGCQVSFRFNCKLTESPLGGRRWSHGRSGCPWFVRGTRPVWVWPPDKDSFRCYALLKERARKRLEQCNHAQTCVETLQDSGANTHAGLDRRRLRAPGAESSWWCRTWWIEDLIRTRRTKSCSLLRRCGGAVWWAEAEGLLNTHTKHRIIVLPRHSSVH